MKTRKSLFKPIKAFAAMMPIANEAENGSETAQAIFGLFSKGIRTNRDDNAYAFGKTPLTEMMSRCIEAYQDVLGRYKPNRNRVSLEKLTGASGASIKWTRDLKQSLAALRESHFVDACIRQALYRPFVSRYVYFDDLWTEAPDQQRRIFPKPESEQENNVIALTAPGSQKPFVVLASRNVCDIHLVGTGAQTLCFPFYSYDEDGTHRRENITDWALDQFRTHYKNPVISKWSIFDYVYGLLHHPGYRTALAAELKTAYPRIPFAPDFRSFQRAGQQLIRLHLDYEKLEPWELQRLEAPGVPPSDHVEKMRLTKDKTALIVNNSLTLGCIPAAVFDYRVGGRSALEWVIDQYQITTNKRTAVISDPNRADDPRYIVRLTGQIVRASLETVGIVNALPQNLHLQQLPTRLAHPTDNFVWHLDPRPALPGRMPRANMGALLELTG